MSLGHVCRSTLSLVNLHLLNTQQFFCVEGPLLHALFATIIVIYSLKLPCIISWSFYRRRFSLSMESSFILHFTCPMTRDGV